MSSLRRLGESHGRRRRHLLLACNNATFEPSVAVFIDGAYRSRSVFAAGDLFDLDRVEVLNGPQSRLYGKNVTAGVLALYTAAPSEHTVSRADVTVGAINSAEDAALFHVTAGVSGPSSLDPRLAQPSYSWINLRTGILRTAWEIARWVNNALGKTVIDHSPLNLHAGDGRYHAFLQQGRSFGVTFRYFQ